MSNDDLAFVLCRQKGDCYVVVNDVERDELIRRMKRLFENNWQTYASRIKIDPGAVSA